MRVDYTKLWQLLTQKEINKTEFSQLTGLSSRTVAKLAANQNVNTDTLARICEILRCDLFDIMELVEAPSAASLFEAYKLEGKKVDQTECFDIHSVQYRSKTYRVWMSKKSADKLTYIDCKENTLVWRKYLPFRSEIMPTPASQIITKLPAFEHDVVNVFVIRGVKPDKITGLDNGNFLSYNHIKEGRYVYVMTLAEFKVFDI